LRRERFQAIERLQIAHKLRRQILAKDNRLRGAGEARVSHETRPFGAARAVQIDRRDRPIGRAR
jgi:hypothetical protein